MALTEADWDRIHRVNAKGVFFCLQTVARTMIPRRSGRIINIASIAGKGYVNTSNVDPYPFRLKISVSGCVPRRSGRPICWYP